MWLRGIRFSHLTVWWQFKAIADAMFTSITDSQSIKMYRDLMVMNDFAKKGRLPTLTLVLLPKPISVCLFAKVNSQKHGTDRRLMVFFTNQSA